MQDVDLRAGSKMESSDSKLDRGVWRSKVDRVIGIHQQQWDRFVEELAAPQRLLEVLKQDMTELFTPEDGGRTYDFCVHC